MARKREFDGAGGRVRATSGRMVVARWLAAVCALAGCAGDDGGDADAAVPGPADASAGAPDARAWPPAHATAGTDVGQPLDDTGVRHIEAERARATGAGRVRINFRLGPYASVADPDWQAHYDAIVDAYLAEGMQVYGLVGAEAVASPAAVGSDEYLDDYAAAFVAVVDRYKDRVRVFESFNEPNNWVAPDTPAIPADRLAVYLERLYLETKLFGGHAGDPAWQVTIVSSALFSFDGNDASSYLDEVYRVGRDQAAWDFVCAETGSFPLDGIGYHVYVQEDAGAALDAVYAALRANLDAVAAVVDTHEAACPTSTPKPFWISEVGWNADYTGDEVQARNVDALFDAYETDPRVAAFLWFTLDDFPGGPYGLYRLDGTERPSLAAFRARAARQF